MFPQVTGSGSRCGRPGIWRAGEPLRQVAEGGGVSARGLSTGARLGWRGGGGQGDAGGMGTTLQVTLRRVARGLGALAVAALAVLVGAGPFPGTATADSGPWRVPLDGEVRVVRAFDPPERRWSPGHRGVDLAASAGDPVRAAGAGRVAFAGTVAGTGAVSIVHGHLRTSYLPVEPRVERGSRVEAGQVIAVVAAEPPHCGGRACLHWGLRRGGDYLDPLALVGRAQVRLLPLGAPPPTARASSGRRLRRAGGPGCRCWSAARSRHGCRSGCWTATRAPGSPARCAGRRRR